jgi:hypothetical protein
MKGQWIGEYAGTNAGTIIVNIDERASCFEGIAYQMRQASTFQVPLHFLEPPIKTKVLLFVLRGFHP